jgi:tetratricopeptide (TPR) repeat protein
VDIPKVQPLLYAGKSWVSDFFEWYKAADLLDILMVPESHVTNRLDRDTLSVAFSSLNELHNVKRVPLDREGLRIDARLEPFRIRFTTNKIGVPHLIKVSYFPNWKVRGAAGVYPVSPHLMLVIPREKEVVLTYGRSLWDYVGMVITTGTLLFLVLAGLARVKRLGLLKSASNPPLVHPLIKEGEKGQALFRGKDGKTNPGLFSMRIRPALMALVLLSAASLIVAGAVLRNKPVRTYVNGYRMYQLGNQLLDAKKVEQADRCFKSAIEAMAPIVEARHSYDHQDVVHCLLFTAMSWERLGEWGKAEAVYRTILQDYPYCRYVGECYVKIGRGVKVGRDHGLEEALQDLGRGHQARAIPLLQKALDQTERSGALLRKAMVEDPYSVWAKYAAQDLEAERSYLKQKLSVLRGFCSVPELRQTLSSFCSENPFGFPHP